MQDIIKTRFCISILWFLIRYRRSCTEFCLRLMMPKIQCAFTFCNTEGHKSFLYQRIVEASVLSPAETSSGWLENMYQIDSKRERLLPVWCFSASLSVLIVSSLWLLLPPPPCPSLLDFWTAARLGVRRRVHKRCRGTKLL